MHYLSYFVVAVAVIGGAYFIIQGDIAESLGMFFKWVKPKFKAFGAKIWPHIRAIRHIRRLVNVPFHLYLHRQTRRMPFCLGQVWVGVLGPMRLIGKTETGDWIADLGKGVTGVGPTHYIRGLVEEHAMYLYEWDQSIDYIPTIGTLNGMRTITLKRQ